jgi:hypothetical protein
VPNGFLPKCRFHAFFQGTQLANRAFDLGIIRQSYYRKLFTQLTKLGYRTSEPAPVADEEPTILRDVVEVHLRDHKYRIKELSRLVLLIEHELRAQYLPEQQRFRLV